MHPHILVQSSVITVGQEGNKAAHLCFPELRHPPHETVLGQFIPIAPPAPKRKKETDLDGGVLVGSGSRFPGMPINAELISSRTEHHSPFVSTTSSKYLTATLWHHDAMAIPNGLYIAERRAKQCAPP